MAARTARLALKREASAPESRAVQSRLMTGLALAAAGGVLGALLLMGDTMEREADTLESAWAARAGPAACAAAELPEGTEVYPAAPQADASCVAERRQPRPAAEGVAVTEQAAVTPAVEPPAAQSAVAKRAKPASRPPTYIRIRKPEPEPDLARLALEVLRGGL